MAYYLELDLGQSSEPTALAIVEDRMDTLPNGAEERHLFLRHLERYPSHTRYPTIAKKVKKRMEDKGLFTQIMNPWAPDPKEVVPPELVMDITAVGKPIVDLFKKKHGIKLRTVGIVGSGEIYVMNADGSGLTNLTDDPAVEDFYPAWRPRVR